MSIEIHPLEKLTLTELCERHCLSVDLHERSKDDAALTDALWFADADVAIVEGSFLRSSVGNGDTDSQALADLAAQINERHLAKLGDDCRFGPYHITGE